MRAPVLLVAFNRPPQTSRVFEAIRAARPPRLYVAADGPRSGRPGEAEKCAEVRRIVTDVDWQCELSTRFGDSNAGCREGVSSAITWFLAHEPEGVILEDDILPVPGFFGFCDAALERYRDDPRVGMVSGVALGKPATAAGRDSPLAARFTRYGLIWGWATWRRVWCRYDAALPDWNASDPRMLRDQPHASPLFVDMWSRLFTGVQRGEIDTWDYQLNYLLMRSGYLSVMPPHNLVDNLGFGEGATHTVEARPAWLVPSADLDVGAVRFGEPAADRALDLAIGRSIFGLSNWAAAKHRLKKIMGLT